MVTSVLTSRMLSTGILVFINQRIMQSSEAQSSSVCCPLRPSFPSCDIICNDAADGEPQTFCCSHVMTVGNDLHFLHTPHMACGGGRGGQTSAEFLLV